MVQVFICIEGGAVQDVFVDGVHLDDFQLAIIDHDDEETPGGELLQPAASPMSDVYDDIYERLVEEGGFTPRTSPPTAPSVPLADPSATPPPSA